MQRSTAILLVGYKRPELILNSIERFRLLGDLQIVVSVDGLKIPDPKLTNEWRAMSISFPDIQWKLRDTNLGLAGHIYTAISEVFDEYQNCIVLEDDVQVEVGPILETKELLNSRLPKSTLTVGLFGGLPYIPFLSKVLRNRWRQTKYFSAWGWGIQREDWVGFTLEIASQYESELDRLIINRLGMSRLSIWKRRFKIVADNPNFTWDYQLFLYSLILNKRHILPTYRTCENVGFEDPRATNTRDPRPSWYKGAASKTVIRRTLRKQVSVISFLLQILDSLTWAGDQPLLQKVKVLKRRLIQKELA